MISCFKYLFNTFNRKNLHIRFRFSFGSLFVLIVFNSQILNVQADTQADCVIKGPLSSDCRISPTTTSFEVQSNASLNSLTVDQYSNPSITNITLNGVISPDQGHGVLIGSNAHPIVIDTFINNGTILGAVSNPNINLYQGSTINTLINSGTISGASILSLILNAGESTLDGSTIGTLVNTSSGLMNISINGDAIKNDNSSIGLIQNDGRITVASGTVINNVNSSITNILNSGEMSISNGGITVHLTW
jgi:hypothetical protein